MKCIEVLKIENPFYRGNIQQSRRSKYTVLCKLKTTNSGFILKNTHFEKKFNQKCVFYLFLHVSMIQINLLELLSPLFIGYTFEERVLLFHEQIEHLNYLVLHQKHGRLLAEDKAHEERYFLLVFYSKFQPVLLEQFSHFFLKV